MAIRSSVKSVEYQVKEFVKKISEEDLRWLSIRFKERIAGDLSEALVLIQEKYGEINRIFNNTPNADCVYDIVDILDRSMQEELKKRINYKK